MTLLFFFFFNLTTAATNSDEMEKLYIHLKEASLSPTGQRKPSTKREFRASFIKRCKNQSVNDKLHLIRTLNSTLKVHTHSGLHTTRVKFKKKPKQKRGSFFIYM